jgi:hypothetical protein
VKVATWNVNGIRAREAQLCDWLERDRPDIVCLQELKATPEQIPARCSHADYHVYWHGMRAYSGVSLHVSKALHGDVPVFAHPAFDMESRIVTVTLGNLSRRDLRMPAADLLRQAPQHAAHRREHAGIHDCEDLVQHPRLLVRSCLREHVAHHLPELGRVVGPQRIGDALPHHLRRGVLRDLIVMALDLGRLGRERRVQVLLQEIR